jgi:hypothetical protein
MSIDGRRADRDALPRPPRLIDLNRLIVFSLIVAGAFVAVGAGLPWLKTITPRWLVLDAAIWFLWSLLGFYFLAALAGLVVVCSSCLAVARAHRRGDRAALQRSLRWLLLASSCLIALFTMELVSALAVRWSYNIPSLPTRFAAAREEGARTNTPSGGDAIDRAGSGIIRSNPGTKRELYVVVVGESSALGVPYQPWVSVGQIVGWQLQRILPGRKVTVDLRAKGGATLEQAMALLASLKRHPDAIIAFSGHNEIQTRFGWSRSVRHYVEEGPESPLALLELARSMSSTGTLILKTLDNYYGETPPPPGVSRELIDHPICTSKEYATTRQEFERRLDALVAYCNAIGTLSILIVPGSNDGSFAPNRSVLAGSTPAADRAAFARAFYEAKGSESGGPTGAITAYRHLVAQHPEFAETHFRLARLLARAQAWDEAREHFIKARDLDGSPFRCPTDFRQAFNDIASRRDVLLVDGPAVLAGLTPHAILDDQLYHDAHHLSLIGTIALAQDILGQLKANQAFGWPRSTPVPRIEIIDCMRHFELGTQKWAKLCERAAEWFSIAASLRYDPSERMEAAVGYRRAGRAIAAGHPLPSGIPASLVRLVSVLEASGARSGR